MPAYFAAACGTSLTASSCSHAPPNLPVCPPQYRPTWTYKQQAALYEYSITTHSHVPCPCSGNGAQRGAQIGQQTPQSAPIRLSSISVQEEPSFVSSRWLRANHRRSNPPHSARRMPPISPSKSSLGDEGLVALHGRG